MCPALFQPWSTLIHHFRASRSAYSNKRPIYGHLEPFWGPMALPSGHSGPGKWSQHIPPDVSWLDPTLIHADPPFRSLQASLWPQEAHLWPFGQFLAIKWAKMAGSKVCLFGSRPSSTQRTTYIHWFSRKDNFEIPPPLNTLCDPWPWVIYPWCLYLYLRPWCMCLWCGYVWCIQRFEAFLQDLSTPFDLYLYLYLQNCC